MISSLLALALASASASAEQTSAPTTAAPASRPRRICRQQERLGTILTRRICRSAEEWAAIDAAQNRITDRDAAHMRNHPRASMRNPEGL